MPDWPSQGGALFDLGTLATYGSASPWGEVAQNTSTTPTSAVWPVANFAYYVPVVVAAPTTVYGFGVSNGATVSGNFDIGLYDERGNLLGHTGSTAQAGVSVAQVVAVTPFSIAPGLYYVALVFDNITATVQHDASPTLQLQSCGIQQQATAFPLPSTATFANPTQANVAVYWAVTGNSGI